MIFPLLLSAAVFAAPQPQVTSRPAPALPALSTADNIRTDDMGHVAVAPVASQAQTLASRLALGSDDWTAIGPFGGDVEALAVHPTDSTIVLAGLAPSTGAGTLYRSTDTGSSWVEVNDLAGRKVYDLEFLNGSTVFAGTDQGVWRSDDAGLTWTDLVMGIGANEIVLDVELDPSNAGTLWAGVSDALGNQTQTLLRSTNSGLTWAPVMPLGGPYSFTSISIDSTNSNKVVAAWAGGFGGGGVFVSSNGGASWINRTAGLPGNPMQEVQVDGSQILIGGGLLFGSQHVGLYRSSNDGATWTELSDVTWPVLTIHSFVVDPTNPARILCASRGSGIYESTDSGATWAFGVGGTGSLSSNSLAFAPSDPSLLFIGSASTAVWKSINAGSLSGPSSIGIGRLNVFSIDSNPNNPSEIAIAFQGQNNGGVQTSLDGGLSWTLEPLPATRYNSVHFGPAGTLYATSDGPSTVAPEGVYTRVGAGWSSIGPDQGVQFETRLYTIAIDPADASGDTLFAGGADFGVAGFEPTLWKTTTRGATWTKAHEGIKAFQAIRAIAQPNLGSGLVVASFTDTGSAPQTGGALRSTNNGNSWAASSTGLDVETQGSDLSLHPDGSTLMLADSDFGAGHGGLFSSSDQGASWTRVSAALTTYFVVHNHLDGTELLTGHPASPRLMASVDGGVNLAAFDNGMPGSFTVRDVLAAPGGGTYYTATSLGIYSHSESIGTTYCPGVANSTGLPGVLSASGSTVAADNAFTVTASQLPNGHVAFFLTSRTQGFIATPGGSQGNLCVLGQFARFNGAGQFGGTAGGSFSFQIPLDNIPEPPTFGAMVMAGDTWNFQLWHRDFVGGLSTSNFTDALEVQFQ